MSKEQILDKHTLTKMSMTNDQRNSILLAMIEHADQESEKKSVAFSEWLIKSLEDVVRNNHNNSELYQYFINNVYNK